jgi:hypothetical protein
MVIWGGPLGNKQELACVFHPVAATGGHGLDAYPTAKCDEARAISPKLQRIAWILGHFIVRGPQLGNKARQAARLRGDAETDGAAEVESQKPASVPG